MIFMAASMEKTMRKKYSSFSCGNERGQATLLHLPSAPQLHTCPSLQDRLPQDICTRCFLCGDSSTPTSHPHMAGSLASHTSLLRVTLSQAVPGHVSTTEATSGSSYPSSLRDFVSLALIPG